MLSEIRGWARIDVSRSGKAWRGSAALSIQYDREITFRGCQISGLNWISSNAPIPRLWRALHSRRNEFWIAWNPVRSSIRPRNTEEDSRPEVEEQWRGKTATFLFLFFSRNQSGWRELSRDDRSGKSGWMVEIEPSVSKRVSVSSASKNVVSTKSILSRVSSRPLDGAMCVCI